MIDKTLSGEPLSSSIEQMIRVVHALAAWSHADPAVKFAAVYGDDFSPGDPYVAEKMPVAAGHLMRWLSVLDNTHKLRLVRAALAGADDQKWHGDMPDRDAVAMTIALMLWDYNTSPADKVRALYGQIEAGTTYGPDGLLVSDAARGDLMRWLPFLAGSQRLFLSAAALDTYGDEAQQRAAR